MVALTETEWGSIVIMIMDLVESCFDFLSGFILVTFGGVQFSMLDLLVSTAFLYILVDFIHDLRLLGVVLLPMSRGPMHMCGLLSVPSVLWQEAVRVDGYFTLSDSLVFNDSVLNGTASYSSAYVVVAGLDFLILAAAALVAINLIILAYVIMKVDLI